MWRGLLYFFATVFLTVRLRPTGLVSVKVCVSLDLSLYLAGPETFYSFLLLQISLVVYLSLSLSLSLVVLSLLVIRM